MGNRQQRFRSRSVRQTGGDRFWSHPAQAILGLQNLGRSTPGSDSIFVRGISPRFKASEDMIEEAQRQALERNSVTVLRFGHDLEKATKRAAMLKAASGAKRPSKHMTPLFQATAEEPFTRKLIKEMQTKDKECQRLKQKLGHGKGTTRSPNGGVGFFLKDGLLMATRGHTPDRRDNARALVPEALRGHLISTYHRSSMLCHPGITVMIQTIAKTYYWAGMARDITRAISGCLGCQRTKTPELFKKTEDFGMVPENPLSVFSLDLYGPMPPDARGNVYVLVIVDNLTRWSSLVPLGGVTRTRRGPGSRVGRTTGMDSQLRDPRHHHLGQRRTIREPYLDRACPLNWFYIKESTSGRTLESGTP